MNRSKREELKFKTKVAIYRLLPNWFSSLIRRRQVPLAKMLQFKQEYANQTIQEPTRFQTIAIIVPCYNHSRYLASAFESIVKQTRPADQVIMIDDASRDETWTLLQKLTASAGAQTKFIIHKNDKNLGQAETINRAIQLATADLVMIMNDDDYLMHDAIEFVVNLFKRNSDLALVGFGNILFKDSKFLKQSKKFIRDYAETEMNKIKITSTQDALRFEDFCSLNMTHTGSTFDRKKALSVGLYWEQNKRIVPFSDRDFQIRMNLLYPVGTNPDVPISFWRTDSSEDRGLNS